MFFHGIPAQYVPDDLYLSPRRTILNKGREQLQDRRGLIRRFGFEPVHLFESSPDFPVSDCVRNCLRYGNVIFLFRSLPLPFWQISHHEIGVQSLDLKEAKAVLLSPQVDKNMDWLKQLSCPVLHLQNGKRSKNATPSIVSDA